MTTIPQLDNDPVELGRRILTAAVELAAGGTRVFPIWGVKVVVAEGGPQRRCGCGGSACPNPGKHPVGRLVPNGHNNASTVHEVVTSWFAVPDNPVNGWVPWNLGVATGRGLVVIDGEAKSNRADLPTGLEVLDDWETWTQGTSIPETHRVRSGGGGLHLWLSVDPNLHIKSRNRVLPNLDVKADGGYVLAAPSVHINGASYEVVDDVARAAIPADLLGWLLTVKGGRYVSRKAGDGTAVQPDDYNFQAIIAGSGCPVGHRDYFVNDLCFRLRRAGTSLEDAAAALRREWLRMESPGGDEFPWESCLYKLRRVWDEVKPEDVSDIPAWRPPGAVGWTTGRTLNGSTDDSERPSPQVVGHTEGDTPGDVPGAAELLNRPELTFNPTDTGNGERFAQRMRDVVRYCTGENRWYLWDGNRWAPDELNRALYLTTEIIKDLYVEAATLQDPQRTSLENWAKTTQSIGHREAMLRVAAAQPGIAIRPDDLDRDPWLLVTRNGTLDLRTGLLRESLPEDLNTRITGVSFDAAAACPLWLKHIKFVTGGDVQLAGWLRRAVGYTLTGLTTEQKLFFLWGNGANGKSTFVDVIAELLGTYSAQADSGLLTGSSEHPTQLAGLRGARLVVADETGQGRKLAEQRVKAITGGKKIKARFMRQDYFEFTPSFKLWITGNHKPEIAGSDHGIWRRLKLVPFLRTLTDDSRILGYDDILIGEGPGILNWALGGLAEWRNVESLGDSELVVRATREYRGEEDVVGQWLDDACHTGPQTLYTVAAALYENYRWWCLQGGFQPLTSTGLGRELSSRGYERDVTKVDGRTTRIWRRVGVGNPVGETVTAGGETGTERANG